MEFGPLSFLKTLNFLSNRDLPQHWDDTAGVATITPHCATFPAHIPQLSQAPITDPSVGSGGGQPCLGPAGACGLAAHPQHRVPSALWAQHSWGGKLNYIQNSAPQSKSFHLQVLAPERLAIHNAVTNALQIPVVFVKVYSPLP